MATRPERGAGAKEASELRADVTRHFETLETYARTELEALADGPKSERHRAAWSAAN
jgi:hypothetical protein